MRFLLVLLIVSLGGNASLIAVLLAGRAGQTGGVAIAWAAGTFVGAVLVMIALADAAGLLEG